MPLELLTLASTLPPAAALDDGESAEPDVDAGQPGDVARPLAEASAEVEPTPETQCAGVGRRQQRVAGDAAAPAPAPDDDPAVFDAAAADALPVAEDWM